MEKKTTRVQYLLESLALMYVVEPEDVWDEACEKIEEDFPYRKIARGQAAPPKILDYLEWRFKVRSREEREIHRNCAEASKKILPFVGKILLVCLVVLYLLSLISGG